LPTCPLTIHALLHIADSIEILGPPWAYWAFPMERFCGHLQPIIHSRRYPFANIDNYVTATAQLAQVKLLYSLGNQLSMRRKATDSPEHSVVLPNYPIHRLLSPMERPIPPLILERVISHLVTRFEVAAPIIRRHLNTTSIGQWARLRQLDDGDDMKAAALLPNAEDQRDATWVRYDLLVDRHSRSRRRTPDFTLESQYGQLIHILTVPLPATTDLKLTEPTTLILGACRQCILSAVNSMNYPVHKNMGAIEVVDIANIVGLIGRVKQLGINIELNEWVILDRSGHVDH
ncbi:hypothetical protein BDN72DRAFT_774893, partial [Pluteus cervinus]